MTTPKIQLGIKANQPKISVPVRFRMKHRDGPKVKISDWNRTCHNKLASSNSDEQRWVTRWNFTVTASLTDSRSSFQWRQSWDKAWAWVLDHGICKSWMWGRWKTSFKPLHPEAWARLVPKTQSSHFTHHPAKQSRISIMCALGKQRGRGALLSYAWLFG